jgi:TolB protein
VFSIYTVPSSGGAPERIVHTGGYNMYPVWSPDGNQLAFASDLGGDHDIWVMSASGGDARRLTFAEGWESYPRWSPDGSRIAFGSDATLEIHAVLVSTGEVEQLTFGQATCPSWSPDGRSIAFSSTRGGGSWDVWVQELEE